MIHLIVSREYPPAAYPPGGIGAYAANIARLLAERGETVHVIGQRWEGAPLERETTCNGKLIIHRIADDDVPTDDADADRLRAELEGLKNTAFPAQWFSWRAAMLAERLVEEEGIEVVEGQEWEAPLYYFLLRRSLGLGPGRRPPCIVHLHSPTELTRHFNGHPATPPPFIVMKRMEAFCIRMADQLLCPSRYLARQASERFHLAADAVKVIPLPVGFTPQLKRSDETWKSGSICFVGRIEPRKGIIEWFEAATRVTKEHPGVHFDFVGADIWGMQETLLRRLPRELLPRFRFHGSKPREELPGFLANAMAGVVPSRWENFPNVCIEAMSSGLPVIATRLGGMVELVEDGRTGWLTPDTGVAGMVDGLAEALRRCLATPGDQRARMGEAAAQAIRRMCDNSRVVEAHIELRTNVARRGATTSIARPAGRAAAPASRAAIIVAVDRLTNAAKLAASLRAQTQPPGKVVVVTTEAPASVEEGTALGWPTAELVVAASEHGAAAWSRGLDVCGRDAADFVLFLDQHDELLPDCLERMAAALRERPDVGIVSCWVAHAEDAARHAIAPSPEPKYQLIDNDVRTASACRMSALPTMPFPPGLPRGYDVWHLANAVMADGWAAVTYPATLARRAGGLRPVRWPDSTALRAVRAELLAGLAATPEVDVMELLDLFVPIPLAGRAASAPRTNVKAKIAYYVDRVLQHPVESVQAIGRKVQSRIARLRPNGDAR